MSAEKYAQWLVNNQDQAGTPEFETVAAAYKKLRVKKPTAAQKEMVDIPSRVLQGARDPITGLSQTLYESVPESVQQTGTNVNKWLYEKTGGLLGLEKPLPEEIKANEAKYQAARQATGQEGMDWARLGGNIATTLPLVMMAPQAATATLPARIASGMAMGGALGATQPVTEGDFWSEKAKQAGAGAIGGGVMAPVAGGLARIVKPLTSKAATKLMKEGITPTPGQILGGAWKRTEEKARSLPILGDFISSGQRRGIKDFNIAAYNRALKPIGKSAKGFPIGREGIYKVKTELSKAYDDLIPKLSFTADQRFASDISNLQKLASGLTEKEAKQFGKILKNQVIGKMTKTGKMSGERYKEVEEILGKEAKGYLKSPDFDARKLGSAIEELKNTMKSTLIRNNPKYAKQLSDINKGYSNYVLLRRAGSMQGAEGGFSPAQLSSASKAMDASVGKGRTATGKAQMQDLTDTAREVLAQSVPNSGTADRLLMDAALLGTGYINPAIPASAFAAGLPYTPIGQRMAAGLLSRRPEGAGLLADAIRQSSPVLGASSASLLGNN